VADHDLKALAQRCKDAGAKDLSRELNKGIKNTVEPLKQDLIISARTTLPRRGGLAKKISESKISISRRPNGLVLRARNAYHLDKMDDPGTLRRPVFRRRSRLQKLFNQKRQSLHHTYRKQRRWVNQKIKPGWFTIPAQKRRPIMIKELDAALTRVAKAIEGRD
jgi:hypothetical protein